MLWDTTTINTELFILTWSLAVIWIDDEDANDEELQAPPHNFSQQ